MIANLRQSHRTPSQSRVGSDARQCERDVSSSRQRGNPLTGNTPTPMDHLRPVYPDEIQHTMGQWPGDFYFVFLVLLSYCIMFACCSCSDFVGVSVSFFFLVLFVLGAQVPTTTDADRPTDAARPSQVGGDSVCGVTAESNDSAE